MTIAPMGVKNLMSNMKFLGHLCNLIANQFRGFLKKNGEEVFKAHFY